MPSYWTHLNWEAQLDLFSTWRFSRLFKAHWTLPTIYKLKHSNSSVLACWAYVCIPSVSPVSFICCVSADWFTHWSSCQCLVLTHGRPIYYFKWHSKFIWILSNFWNLLYAVSSDEKMTLVNSYCFVIHKVTEQEFWWLIVNWSVKQLIGPSFSNMRICRFSLFPVNTNLMWLAFWTVGWTKQANWEGHLSHLGSRDGHFHHAWHVMAKGLIGSRLWLFVWNETRHHRQYVSRTAPSKTDYLHKY